MKAFSVRVSDDLHEKATTKANEENMSLAELVRAAVHTYCTQEDSVSSEVLDELRVQLHTKDQQLQSLHESTHQQNAIIMQQTQQLERTHLQLEDLSRGKTVWQRVKAAFAPQGT